MNIGSFKFRKKIYIASYSSIGVALSFALVFSSCSSPKEEEDEENQAEGVVQGESKITKTSSGEVASRPDLSADENKILQGLQKGDALSGTVLYLDSPVAGMVTLTDVKIVPAATSATLSLTSPMPVNTVYIDRSMCQGECTVGSSVSPNLPRSPDLGINYQDGTLVVSQERRITPQPGGAFAVCSMIPTALEGSSNCTAVAPGAPRTRPRTASCPEDLVRSGTPCFTQILASGGSSKQPKQCEPTTCKSGWKSVLTDAALCLYKCVVDYGPNFVDELAPPPESPDNSSTVATDSSSNDSSTNNCRVTRGPVPECGEGTYLRVDPVTCNQSCSTSNDSANSPSLMPNLPDVSRLIPFHMAMLDSAMRLMTLKQLIASTVEAIGGLNNSPVTTSDGMVAVPTNPVANNLTTLKRDERSLEIEYIQALINLSSNDSAKQMCGAIMVAGFMVKADGTDCRPTPETTCDLREWLVKGYRINLNSCDAVSQNYDLGSLNDEPVVCELQDRTGLSDGSGCHYYTDTCRRDQLISQGYNRPCA